MTRVARYHADRTNQKLYFARLSCQQAEQIDHVQQAQAYREAALPKIDADDESSPMYWGNILEPIVATHYTKHSGHKVRRINAVLQHPDKDKSWMLANLDYAVVGAEDVQILECKTASGFGIKGKGRG